MHLYTFVCICLYAIDNQAAQLVYNRPPWAVIRLTEPPPSVRTKFLTWADVDWEVSVGQKNLNVQTKTHIVQAHNALIVQRESVVLVCKFFANCQLQFLAGLALSKITSMEYLESSF